MNNLIKFGGVFLIALCVIFGSSGLLGGLYVWSTYDSAADLQVRYETKLKANEAEFDNMWKVIQQSAKFPEQKKEAFRQIFVEYAEARTSDSAGSVMNWVQENSPNFDLSIYDKTQNIIIGSRNGWTMRQTELLGISEQYNKLYARGLSGFILKTFGFEKIEPKIITSTRTQETFKTGLDDKVE